MLGQLTQFIANIFRFHKLKLFVVFFVAVIFLVILFPSKDLSDYVSGEAGHLMGIYTRMDDLSISLFPSPGIRTQNLVVEAADLPPVSASTVNITASLMSALAMKIGVNADATGLFGGDVIVDFQDGEKLKSGDRLKIVSVQAQNMNLADFSEFLRSGNIAPLTMQGTLKLKTDLKVDPSFNQQPQGSIGAEVASFVLPSQTVPTQMGPLQTPPLQLGKIVLQLKMNEGQIDIQEMTFGGPKDGLSGKIKGQFGVSLRRDATGVRTIPGLYDVTIDMTVLNSFSEANAKTGVDLMLSLLKDYKQDLPNSSRYTFRLKPGAGGMPTPQRM